MQGLSYNLGKIAMFYCYHRKTNEFGKAKRLLNYSIVTQQWKRLSTMNHYPAETMIVEKVNLESEETDDYATSIREDSNDSESEDEYNSNDPVDDSAVDNDDDSAVDDNFTVDNEYQEEEIDFTNVSTKHNASIVLVGIIAAWLIPLVVATLV